MLVRCALLSFLLMAQAVGEEIALVRIGDSWRFAPGANQAAALGSTWTVAGFDDSLWLAGKSGFSAGYGAEEATPLPGFGTNCVSVLFRRVFTVAKPTQVKWLTFRIDYSQGFVAYLNGQEVARRNLEGQPGQPVALTAISTNYHSRGEPEEFDVTAARVALVQGDNVLSVQLHRVAPYAAFCLGAELFANFNRAPYIQNLSSNQVHILWKTPVSSDTRIEYGTNAALGLTATGDAFTTNHFTVLRDLSPDSTYYYQATSGTDAERVISPMASFHTFKPEGSISFMVVGDGGWNSLAQYRIAEVIRESQPDLVLETGDNVYPMFTAALADPRCFSVYQAHMAGTPYFFALGNHDLYAGVRSYLDAFDLPTNSVPLAEHSWANTSPEHYYSFDQGDAHFTVLFVPFFSQYQLMQSDAQYRWLTNDLASTRKPWKIVVAHLPMNSSSAHRFDDMNYNGIPDRLELQEVLLPALSQYGVQLVLSGHEHGYERFNPTNGVHAITTAGGGVPLYGFTQLDTASALFWVRFNCVRITIQGDTLLAQAIGMEGDVFDEMTIQRAPPEATKTFQAAWHSPTFPLTSADDGDGNVLGQVFDFKGEPIPAVSGQFSNLGRAYLNHDGTNLYVGFQGVMIYGNNDVFLFVESPRLPGVTNLFEVGNGLIDPKGQGVDGLDMLSNLAFTNFTPSIGCVLGDEWADGPDRSFARRAVEVGAGQGVFRLNATLEDIPGIRMQQFHLSPQTQGALAEENANFIEVAMPLDQLGYPQPGDVLRIGAVVGGPEIDPVHQTRQVDSGFLGTRLIQLGPNAAALQGVAVRLAAPSVFRLGFELSDTGLRISWLGEPGRKYRIQASEGSLTNFVDLEDLDVPVSAASTNLYYDVTAPAPTTKSRFFRVRSQAR